MAAIDGAIGLEGVGEASSVREDHVGVLPLAAKVEDGPMLGAEHRGEYGRIGHVESDGFAVGEPVEVGAHGSVEVGADDLAARGANVGGAAQIRMWVAGAAFSRNEGNCAVGRSLC